MTNVTRLLGALVLMATVLGSAGSHAVVAAGSALSSDDIRAAINRGAKNAGQEQGVVLVDVGRVIGSIFGQFGASQGQLTPGTQVLSTGFQVTLYSPFLWVAREASQSPQLMNASEVDPDLLRPVLHVVALPSLPPDVGPNFGTDVSPVVDVVLRDGANRNETFPTMRQPFLHNGLRGLTVEFPLDAVAALRDSRSEFHIIVKGTNGNSKDFTVKRKHLAALRLD